jgi:hypothetical protein
MQRTWWTQKSKRYKPALNSHLSYSIINEVSFQSWYVLKQVFHFDSSILILNVFIIGGREGDGCDYKVVAEKTVMVMLYSGSFNKQ